MTSASTAAPAPAQQSRPLPVAPDARRDAATITETIQAADRLQRAGRLDDAVQVYRDWIAVGDPYHRHLACFNCGTLLGASGRHAEAAEIYRQALALAPGFVEARLNLGHQLEHLGEPDAALAQWAQVRAREPLAPVHRLHAINNSARLLETLRRYDQAEAAMVESLSLDPAQPDVIQHYVHIRQKQCKWPVYQPVGRVSENQLLMATSALAMLSASDDPALQLLAAYRFVGDKYPAARGQAPLWRPRARAPGERIRIGYLSGDLCMHAMGLLIPELLELHDRARFEVVGFCFSREDGSALRARLVGALDRHVRIGTLDDTAAARLIADAGIDVLVDLHGLSSGARPMILAHRPAPVQVGYLGLPATSAVPGVDHMIADPYVMPPELERFCTERPMRVPHCYQVCDRARPIAETPPRDAYGLPPDAFVYCSFNNNHKFSQPVFESWMRVLAAVPGSVLWLLADNPWAQENMLACAERFGVARERLVFAPRVAPPEYLARFRLADLFLDTFPYNAGATASDALWMGLPILTRSGRSYISRMAGSLLTNVGLPDLITTTPDEYERMAIALGRHPQRVRSYRRYLEDEGRRSRLFDVPALVRDIEDGFERLVLEHERRLPAGASPAGTGIAFAGTGTLQ
ncbi:MAG: tetratricopeptide repeat protein [Lautropia sp.]